MTRLANQLPQLPAAPLGILCVDGALELPAEHWSERLFDREREGIDTEALRDHCEMLESLGLQVQVVHASEGRTLNVRELIPLQVAS